jgi:hypothetical protein
MRLAKKKKCSLMVLFSARCSFQQNQISAFVFAQAFLVLFFTGRRQTNAWNICCETRTQMLPASEAQ